MNKLKHKRIKENISEKLEFPKEVIMNIPKITILGNIQALIENYIGIIEYTDKIVRINTTIGIINISGSEFIIKKIVEDEVIISGFIENINIVV